MEQINKRRRITVRLKCPNPLFEQWLVEWRDDAKQKESKMEHCFSKALRSLQKYPLPLETGRDCKVLSGFGDKLCKMLDDRLREHKVNVPSSSAVDDQTIANVQVADILKTFGKKNTLIRDNSKGNIKSPTSSRKEYIPQHGTGPFAILLALYKLSQNPHYVGHSSKKEIIKAGQEYCEQSFTKPMPGSWYTSWSSMQSLIQKQLVSKWSNPAKFCLTEEGTVLALKLYSSVSNTENINCLDKELSNMTATVCRTEVVGRQLSVGSVESTRQNVKQAFPSCSNENQFEKIIENLVSITGTYSVDTPINSSCKNEHSGQDKHTAKDLYGFVKSNRIEPEKMPPPKSRTTSHVSKILSKKQSSTAVSQASSTSQEEETVFLMPNDFNIILLVDTQETLGSKARADDPIIIELRKLNVQFEVRHLKVGDYTWICRENTSNYELVLPYIIERKRMDDLGSSIKDGRFHEQKFRLKQSGVQNLIYLIENYGNNAHAGLPITSLYQAAINTMVQDQFVVKIVDNTHETAGYLSRFTSLLNKYYKTKTLMSCSKENLTPSTPEDDLIPLLTFKEFSKTGTKNKQLKVKDLFVRQLLQIKGMSVEKALAIANVYQTPKQLRLAYSGKSETEAEKLLSTIQFGNLKKNIGPVLSKILFQLFSLKQF